MDPCKIKLKLSHIKLLLQADGRDRHSDSVREIGFTFGISIPKISPTIKVIKHRAHLRMVDLGGIIRDVTSL